MLGEKYSIPGLPNTCAKIMWYCASWETRKAQDSSCLYTNCEGMNSLRRGVTGACATIETITKSGLESANYSSNASIFNDPHTSSEIKAIISVPFKYDTIVACLQPCLTSKKLEDAKYSCLHRSNCSLCGFHRLWLNGPRKTLLEDTEDCSDENFDDNKDEGNNTEDACEDKDKED